MALSNVVYKMSISIKEYKHQIESLKSTVNILNQVNDDCRRKLLEKSNAVLALDKKLKEYEEKIKKISVFFDGGAK